MIPRTVLMAQEVAAQFTPTELEDYGNIILNGYATTGPNTANIKAWQYQETSTAPINLPSVTSVQPMLRGWTTNYFEYFTQLQPNGYGVNPGDPTMFSYRVHSFEPQTGGIQTIGGNGTWITGGSNYTPGTYTNVSLTGGSGSGAKATIVVKNLIGTTGPIITWTQVQPGQGYGSGVFVFENPAVTASGKGYGATFSTTTNLSPPFAMNVFDLVNPGTDYAVGDLVFFPGGSKRPTTPAGSALDAYVRVDSVGYAGVVTSVTITTAGTGYKVGEAVSAVLPGTGGGFSAPVSAINPTPGTGGQYQWAQTPRRFFQNTVSSVTPPQYINNPNVIQYSFIYPVADNPVEPPIDTLS